MSITGVIIPAHLHSTRFPGKPLALVGGKPLLSYAVECAKGTGMPYVVATSDMEIYKWCHENGVPRRHTDQCRNGTERAALANREEKWDRVVVLQCDEPDLRPDDLGILTGMESPATLVSHCADSDWGNPNSVIAQYMLMHDWEENIWCDGAIRWFRRGESKSDGRQRHVGCYLYDGALLEQYLTTPPTPAEESQSLEQLRTMAIGYAWEAFNPHRTIDPRRLRSINVPEDADKFKEDGNRV